MNQNILLKIYQNNDETCIKIAFINSDRYMKEKENVNEDFLDEDEFVNISNPSISEVRENQYTSHQLCTITKRKNSETTVDIQLFNRLDDRLNDFFSHSNILFSMDMTISGFCNGIHSLMAFKKENSAAFKAMPLESIIKNFFVVTPVKSHDIDPSAPIEPKKENYINKPISWLLTLLVFLKEHPYFEEYGDMRLRHKDIPSIFPNFQNTSYIKIITKKDKKVLFVDGLGILLSIVLILSPSIKFHIQPDYLNLIVHGIVFLAGWLLLIAFSRAYIYDKYIMEEKLQPNLSQSAKNLLEIANNINTPVEEMAPIDSCNNSNTLPNV